MLPANHTRNKKTKQTNKQKKQPVSSLSVCRITREHRQPLIHSILVSGALRERIPLSAGRKLCRRLDKWPPRGCRSWTGTSAARGARSVFAPPPPAAARTAGSEARPAWRCWHRSRPPSRAYRIVKAQINQRPLPYQCLPLMKGFGISILLCDLRQAAP